MDWSATLQQSFDAIKATLATATPLVHPLPHVELSLATDASNAHISRVLQQKEVKGWWPMGYFSKKLSSSKAKYLAFDRELLATFASIH